VRGPHAQAGGGGRWPAVEAVLPCSCWCRRRVRPKKRYLKGYLDYSKTTASGLVATVIDIFNSGMDVFKIPTRNQMFFFQPSQAQESLPSTVFHWESLQLVHQLIDTPHLMKVIPLGAGLSQGMKGLTSSQPIRMDFYLWSFSPMGLVPCEQRTAAFAATLHLMAMLCTWLQLNTGGPQKVTRLSSSS